MKHTGGLLEQMKDAKPFKTLSIKEIDKNWKAAIKDMDKQHQRTPYYFMGSREYNKFRLNPKQYFEDLINSICR